MIVTFCNINLHLYTGFIQRMFWFFIFFIYFLHYNQIKEDRLVKTT